MEELTMRTLPCTAIALTLAVGLLAASPADARRVYRFVDTQQPPVSLDISPGLAQTMAQADAAAANPQPGQPPVAASNGVPPPMQVRSIGTNVDGEREVLLEQAGRPGNTAAIRWPNQAGDPSVLFHVGQTVQFDPTPSEGHNGLMARDPQGRPLTHIPAPNPPAQGGY